MRQKPIVLKDGKLSQLPAEDTLDGQDNFSYKKIKSAEVVTIREDQQMLLSGDLAVLGQMNLLGEVVLIDIEDSDTAQVIPPSDPENFSHFRIASLAEKTIPQNQQMNVFGPLYLDGQLSVLGEVNLGQLAQEIPEVPTLEETENYSWRKILAGQNKIVPTNQQMAVVGDIVVLGQLQVLGEIAIISGAVPTDLEDDYLPPFEIGAGETFTVKARRLMFLPRALLNFGQLNVFGELALGGL